MKKKWTAILKAIGLTIMLMVAVFSIGALSKSCDANMETGEATSIENIKSPK